MPIPSRQQWKGWNFLEKLTAIGVYSGILSLFVAAWQIFPTYNRADELEESSIVGEWYLTSLKTTSGAIIHIDEQTVNSWRFQKDFSHINVNEPVIVFHKNSQVSTQLSSYTSIDRDGRMVTRHGEAATQGQVTFYSTNGHQIFLDVSKKENGEVLFQSKLEYKINNGILELHDGGSRNPIFSEMKLTRKLKSFIRISRPFFSNREIIAALSDKTIELEGRLIFLSKNNSIKSDTSLNDLGEDFILTSQSSQMGRDILLSSGDGIWFARDDILYIAPYPIVKGMNDGKIMKNSYRLFKNSSGSIVLCFLGEDPSESCRPGHVLRVRDGDDAGFSQNLSDITKRAEKPMAGHNSNASDIIRFESYYDMGLAFLSTASKEPEHFSAAQGYLQIATINGHQKAACELIFLYDRSSIGTTKEKIRWLSKQDHNKITKWNKISFQVTPSCNRSTKITLPPPAKPK